jgi:hypothetical protein
MKKYKIEISYSTGDSFGIHDEIRSLELTFDNIEIAKENLKRIKEHYELFSFYEKGHVYKNKHTKKEAIEVASKQPWFVKSHWKYSISLKINEGKEQRINTFWCGYFDHLNGASIKLNDPQEDEMSVSF